MTDFESFLQANNNFGIAEFRTIRTAHKLLTSNVMKQPIVRQRKKHYAGKTSPRANYSADFETTTDLNDCRVWAWGISDINLSPNDVEMGNTIESFIELIGQHNSNVYFFNLKFDGHFIIDWLLRHDFLHISGNDVRRPGQFSTLISDLGKVYSIVVKWENGHVTEFRDAAKKFSANMSVKRLAETFNLEIRKGELDYDLPRPKGHILTDDEKAYLANDVAIVAQALKIQFDAGMKKLTIGSDSMAEYKNLTGMKKFQSYFPIFSEELDNEIRRAYRGGFTYADPRFWKKRQNRHGIVLDVNSLYPSVMVNRPLPYGTPRFVEGKPETSPEWPLSVFCITFTAKLKPGHIPCIQIKSHPFFSSTEYLTEIKQPTEMMMTNVDWDLYNDHYNIDVLSYDGGWLFRASNTLFQDYVEKWGGIKAASKDGMREIAKLHLNSLYGKFATNPHMGNKYPVLEDNKVKFKTGEPELKNPVYTPVGVFVTSWARDLTIRAAQANYDTFAYADTDSLHLLTDTVPDSIDVHPTKLGAWKLEYEFDAAFYIRAKAYMEHNVNGEYVTHIAGLPSKIAKDMTFDDLVDRKVFHGKLLPKSVPGGIVLVDTPFELRL